MVENRKNVDSKSRQHYRIKSPQPTASGQKDIFVKKCEGFQRLAVTYEYNQL